MINNLKDSCNLLNTYNKELLRFFIMISIASIFGSLIFPFGGYVLSVGIFIYANQIIMKFAKNRDIDVEELDEPFYAGIIKTYGFKILLFIPMIFITIFLTANLLKDIITLGFNSIIFSGFREGFLKFSGIIFKFFMYMTLSNIVLKLLFPFSELVFLDEDLKDNGFLKNIFLSFTLANGYRFRVLLLLMLNIVFVCISMLTFGLALIYFYPLHIIMLSNLYFESKNKRNV